MCLNTCFRAIIYLPHASPLLKRRCFFPKLQVGYIAGSSLQPLHLQKVGTKIRQGLSWGFSFWVLDVWDMGYGITSSIQQSFESNSWKNIFLDVTKLPPKKVNIFIFYIAGDASFIAQDGLITVFFPGSNSPLQRHLMKFLTATTREAHRFRGGNLWRLER